MAGEKCSVEGCGHEAAAEVRLYDVYADGTGFDKQDYTCPFLCATHLLENEQRANGERRPRGITRYPFSNQHIAQGFTIYRWLREE